MRSDVLCGKGTQWPFGTDSPFWSLSQFMYLFPSPGIYGHTHREREPRTN